MIAHVSIFDPLDDGELAELKAHAADWVAEAAHARQSRRSLASWQLSEGLRMRLPSTPPPVNAAGSVA